MAYKLIVRQEMPECYMGNPDYPVMDACIEFLRDIHNEDKTYDNIPAFAEDLRRYPAFLADKRVKVAEKEMRTNPTLVDSFGLEGAYSIIVTSELSYVKGREDKGICWLGNLIPEEMLSDESFDAWCGLKESMARRMQQLAGV